MIQAMEFWNAIGDFLATLEPKDWVTTGLALAAIIVSIWTASQTWRYHPKPLLTVDACGVQPFSTPVMGLNNATGPYLWVTVTNRGNAPAHDLSLVIRVRGRKDATLGGKQLAPGASVGFDHELARMRQHEEPVTRA